METLGKRIAHFRKKIGISQKDLAVAAGITPTALNYYEKDKRQPNVLILIRLVKALNVTGGALLGLEPPTDMITKSKNEFHALHTLRNLNSLGQEKVLEYMSDLSEVSKYTEKKVATNKKIGRNN